MKRCTLHGWILLEAVLAMACVALVISATQYQLNQLTQQMFELQTTHQQSARNALYGQMQEIFAQTPSIQGTLTAAPSCQQCRGSQLQAVLQYELSQW